jgi:Protein of unknown function (DUF3108)
MSFERTSSRRRRIGVWALVLSAPLVFLFAMRSVLAFSLFADVGARAKANGWSPADSDSIVQPNEVVVFEASYLFFKLGTVRFEFLGEQECRGVPAYRIRAFIDSYSGIPFVDLHSVYETCADPKTLMCLVTSNDQEEGDSWVHTNYVFNYARRRLEWDQSVKGVVTKKVDLPLDTTYTDGLSFFYYVRTACARSDGRKIEMTIPIVSDTVRSSVTLTVNEKREACDVAAFDYPIESERMSGHINFKGTFGVTGDFVGWISADSAEVPLRAELRVLIGSIVVKLKDIHRRGWNPPKAN